MSLFERKILGRIQNRLGPNRVGPFGLLQPAADGIKMLIKEDIVPLRADKVVHFLAPILMAATAILALGIIPYGRNMTPFAIDGGILFFFAIGSTTELSVFMAGWGSNNKFSMLGAMRAIAQMISYELPLDHHRAAGGDGGRLASARCDRRGAGRLLVRHFAALVCLHALGLGGFPVVFRFRLGGVEPHAVRCAGRRIGNRRRAHDGIFRLQIRDFFPGGIFRDVRDQRARGDALSRRLACAVALPRGGARLIFGSSENSASLLFVFIWIRGTLPRTRVDQVMGFAWKFMLPMAFACVLAAAVWHYGGRRWTGWLYSLGVVAMAYLALGQLLQTGKRFAPRTYRYAE